MDRTQAAAHRDEAAMRDRTAEKAQVEAQEEAAQAERARLDAEETARRAEEERSGAEQHRQLADEIDPDVESAYRDPARAPSAPRPRRRGRPSVARRSAGSSW